MPIYCIRGQKPCSVSFWPLRTRKALVKLCAPSRGTDPSPSDRGQDETEDPDVLQSFEDLETTAGRIWSLTMDVAAETTKGGSSEQEEGENLVLQQRLEDLSMLQTTQMQQLIEVSLALSLAKYAIFSANSGSAKLV